MNTQHTSRDMLMFSVDNLREQSRLAGALFTDKELNLIADQIDDIAYKLWDRRGLPTPVSPDVAAKEAASVRDDFARMERDRLRDS